MGGLTITTYLTTTVIAVSIGLLVVNTIKPGESISDETRTELLNAYSTDADEKEIQKKRKILGHFNHLLI